VLWWHQYPWFRLNYIGGVSVAALLVSYTRSVDIGAVSIILPLLLISYLTYRTSLGRIEDAKRHVDQLNELYLSTIETLAMAVDAKDQITHGHIRRVQVYATELAKRLGVSEERQLKAVESAALLHDMGKLAIPEHILNKPGKLTVAEFNRMKQHADLGADLLSSIRFPYPVVPIVRHHHENWDGSGYPAGISGTDIPLGARILSVVDCFDALTSDRPYRPRLTNDDAFKILRQRRGAMYDPMVVDMFIRVFPEISPAAIRAGQEARSMLMPSADVSLEPLEHIRAAASESALVSSSCQDIVRAATPRKAFEAAVECVRQLTPVNLIVLYRYRPDSDILAADMTSGDPNGILTGFNIRLGQRVTGWCAANRNTAVNSVASLDLAQISNGFVPPLRSVLSTPLVDGETLLGVLTGYSGREEAFSHEHVHIWEQVAATLSQSLVEVSQLVSHGEIARFTREKNR
jgi:putative nucleotidyltransferase with HDIG domain